MTKTVLTLAALAILAAPRAHADAKAVSRDEATAACVKNREKAFECKEPFIDAMIDMRLRAAGKTVPAEQRAKMRERGLQEIAEDGAGALPPRQAKCEKMIDKLGGRGMGLERGTLASLDACYAEKDCKARVACMMPIMEALMFPKKK